MTAGEQLRALRERLGLSLRMVEFASGRIADKYANPDYFIAPSRLSDIETKGITPNVYRIYSLSIIYQIDFLQMLRRYGIDLANVPADLDLANIPRTHTTDALESQTHAEMPLQMDPSFEERSSAPIARMVQQWGSVPVPLLKKFADRKFTYGYVGREDWTMYPLILPGAFIQVDEGRRKVEEGIWRSEFERPIYFVEMRESFVCCWCEVTGNILTLKPHPMSPVKTRFVRMGSEAEVVGQVVGVAMRLDGWIEPPAGPAV